jgi:hypothetical protein
MLPQPITLRRFQIFTSETLERARRYQANEAVAQRLHFLWQSMILPLLGPITWVCAKAGLAAPVQAPNKDLPQSAQCHAMVVTTGHLLARTGHMALSFHFTVADDVRASNVFWGGGADVILSWQTMHAARGTESQS